MLWYASASGWERHSVFLWLPLSHTVSPGRYGHVVPCLHLEGQPPLPRSPFSLRSDPLLLHHADPQPLSRWPGFLRWRSFKSLRGGHSPQVAGAEPCVEGHPCPHLVELTVCCAPAMPPLAISYDNFPPALAYLLHTERLRSVVTQHTPESFSTLLLFCLRGPKCNWGVG